MIGVIPRLGRVIVATSVIGLTLTSAYFYARWQHEAAAHANTRTTALAA
jgi:hypothetical protein